MIELGVSVLVAVIFYVMDYVDRENRERIVKLENRVSELEYLLKPKE